MENRPSFPFIFILSGIFHVVIALCLIGLSALFPLNRAAPASVTEVEIEYPEIIKNSGKEKQIIRQAAVPERMKDLENNQDARFFSEETQRVKEEQRVKQTGKTQNASASQTSPPKTPSLKSLTQTTKDIQGFHPKLEQSPDGELSQASNDLHESDFEKALRKPPPHPAAQPSTLGEALPEDISVGSMTALNTNRLTYYSFYARVEDLIRYRWESRVWQALQSFDHNYLRSIVSQRAWVTQAEFYLDPKGKLVKAVVMKPSGIVKFDQSSLNAFKEAAIFPNPPKELIQDDGFIHLKYSFSVNYSIR